METGEHYFGLPASDLDRCKYSGACIVLLRGPSVLSGWVTKEVYLWVNLSRRMGEGKTGSRLFAHRAHCDFIGVSFYQLQLVGAKLRKPGLQSNVNMSKSSCEANAPTTSY